MSGSVLKRILQNVSPVTIMLSGLTTAAVANNYESIQNVIAHVFLQSGDHSESPRTEDPNEELGNNDQNFQPPYKPKDEHEQYISNAIVRAIQIEKEQTAYQVSLDRLNEITLEVGLEKQRELAKWGIIVSTGTVYKLASDAVAESAISKEISN